MISKGKPYSVSVNFGFIVKDTETKSLSLFIHVAGSGKKFSALKENPEVSFSTETGVSIALLIILMSHSHGQLFTKA